MNVIKVKAKVSRKLFYDQDKAYGGFSFYPIESSEEIKVHKKYGNFAVVGNCPMFMDDKVYNFTVRPTWNKKYGDGYEFVEVEERTLNTVGEQQEYLRQVVSNREADILISAYPNVMIIDYIKENKIDINNLKGIKESKLAKIQERITMYDGLKIALIELKGLGISMNALQRLVDHFGSQETLISRVKENIYLLTEIDMFGFRTVDDYAMKRGDEKDSVNRIKACFEYVIKEEAKDGHAWVHVDTFISKCEGLLDIDTVKIVNVINQLKEKPEKFYIHDEKVSLKLYYNYELGIKRHLDRLIKDYHSHFVYKDIKEVEEKIGFTYTDEQREAIKLSQKHGVFVLNGRGGSGKTSTLVGIIESHENIHYIAVALSGKASSVLSSKGIRSSTIHRLLGVGSNGKFKYNIENQLPHNVIILDEASMVNSQLFYSLLQAIPSGSKVIIVGDDGQLPPIGLSAVFSDLLQTGYYPNKELTQVHRQAQKSGILTTANTIRDGQKINGRYEYDAKSYGELKDMVLIPLANREDIFEQILDISKGYFQKYGEQSFSDFQILTAVKKKGDNSVLNLNKNLQGIFNDLEKDFLERGGYEYREGDKVIHSGNNYNAVIFSDYDAYLKVSDYEIEEIEEDPELEQLIVKGSVFNGTIGRIEHINFDKKEVLIRFEDIDGLVLYTQQELNMIELGYAITVHRSQGIGVKNVLATFDYVAYKLLSKQMVYTAFTRASEKLVVICENGALHKAIETDHGSTRNTFLKELINGGIG